VTPRRRIGLNGFCHDPVVAPATFRPTVVQDGLRRATAILIALPDKFGTRGDPGQPSRRFNRRLTLDTVDQTF